MFDDVGNRTEFDPSTETLPSNQVGDLLQAQIASYEEIQNQALFILRTIVAIGALVLIFARDFIGVVLRESRIQLILNPGSIQNTADTVSAFTLVGLSTLLVPVILSIFLAVVLFLLALLPGPLRPGLGSKARRRILVTESEDTSSAEDWLSHNNEVLRRSRERVESGETLLLIAVVIVAIGGLQFSLIQAGLIQAVVAIDAIVVVSYLAWILFILYQFGTWIISGVRTILAGGGEVPTLPGGETMKESFYEDLYYTWRNIGVESTFFAMTITVGTAYYTAGTFFMAVLIWFG